MLYKFRTLLFWIPKSSITWLPMCTTKGYNFEQNAYLKFIWFTCWVLYWLIRDLLTSCWERRSKPRFGSSLSPRNELLDCVQSRDPWPRTCTKCCLLTHQVGNKCVTDMHAHTQRDWNGSAFPNSHLGYLCYAVKWRGTPIKNPCIILEMLCTNLPEFL